ncbi:MAG: hypothetical protein QW409_01315 [Candidatus Aenigmatarchaeota archaeon]
MEEITKRIKNNFDAEIPKDLDFEIRNDRIYVFKKEIRNLYEFLRFKNVRLEKLGIYFGRLKRNDKIQLSIEGAQIVGKTAKKNVIEINDIETLKRFLKEEISLSIDDFKNVEKHNFPIVKYRNYIITAAASLDKEIKSLFPKNAKKLLYE